MCGRRLRTINISWTNGKFVVNEYDEYDDYDACDELRADAPYTACK